MTYTTRKELAAMEGTNLHIQGEQLVEECDRCGKYTELYEDGELCVCEDCLDYGTHDY